MQKSDILKLLGKLNSMFSISPSQFLQDSYILLSSNSSCLINFSSCDISLLVKSFKNSTIVLYLSDFKDGTLLANSHVSNNGLYFGKEDIILLLLNTSSSTFLTVKVIAINYYNIN